MENTCQKILKDELAQRKSRNSSYSLRALSRDLGISLTAVSDCIAGKRNLSKTNIKKLSESLHFSQAIQEQLLKTNRKGARSKEASESIRRFLIAEDSFKLISNWYYLAILNLPKVVDHRVDAAWIADRLGISEIEVENALERLLDMGFLKIEGAKLVRTDLSLSTIDDVPSIGVKKYHADTLKKAVDAVYDVPVDKREILSTTMAIDSRKIKEIKKILHGTLDKVEDVLESDEADEVYSFSMQLFPLTNAKGI